MRIFVSGGHCHPQDACLRHISGLLGSNGLALSAPTLSTAAIQLATTSDVILLSLRTPSLCEEALSILSALEQLLSTGTTALRPRGILVLSSLHTWAGCSGALDEAASGQRLPAPGSAGEALLALEQRCLGLCQRAGAPPVHILATGLIYGSGESALAPFFAAAASTTWATLPQPLHPAPALPAPTSPAALQLPRLPAAAPLPLLHSEDLGAAVAAIAARLVSAPWPPPPGLLNPPYTPKSLPAYMVAQDGCPHTLPALGAAIARCLGSGAWEESSSWQWQGSAVPLRSSSSGGGGAGEEEGEDSCDVQLLTAPPLPSLPTAAAAAAAALSRLLPASRWSHREGILPSLTSGALGREYAAARGMRPLRLALTGRSTPPRAALAAALAAHSFAPSHGLPLITLAAAVQAVLGVRDSSSSSGSGSGHRAFLMGGGSAGEQAALDALVEEVAGAAAADSAAAAREHEESVQACHAALAAAAAAAGAAAAAAAAAAAPPPAAKAPKGAAAAAATAPSTPAYTPPATLPELIAAAEAEGIPAPPLTPRPMRLPSALLSKCLRAVLCCPAVRTFGYVVEGWPRCHQEVGEVLHLVRPQSREEEEARAVAAAAAAAAAEEARRVAAAAAEEARVAAEAAAAAAAAADKGKGKKGGAAAGAAAAAAPAATPASEPAAAAGGGKTKSAREEEEAQDAAALAALRLALAGTSYIPPAALQGLWGSSSAAAEAAGVGAEALPEAAAETATTAEEGGQSTAAAPVELDPELAPQLMLVCAGPAAEEAAPAASRKAVRELLHHALHFVPAPAPAEEQAAAAAAAAAAALPQPALLLTPTAALAASPTLQTTLLNLAVLTAPVQRAPVVVQRPLSTSSRLSQQQQQQLLQPVAPPLGWPAERPAVQAAAGAGVTVAYLPGPEEGGEAMRALVRAGLLPGYSQPPPPAPVAAAAAEAVERVEGATPSPLVMAELELLLHRTLGERQRALEVAVGRA